MKKYCIFAKNDLKAIELKKYLQDKIVSLSYDDGNPDLVIVIGGDGTVLRAVHQYIALIDKASFVGIHLGTLGFYTDILLNEVDSFIENINNSNDNRIVKSDILEITVNDKKYFAINEVRLENNLSTMILDVVIDGEKLERFRGNGICLSTTSGSTGYNKSLNGAIIYPGNRLMQLVEIAGIHHNAYRSLNSPLILPECQIEFNLISKDNLVMGIDHLSYQIENVDKVSCKLSSKVVNFAKFNKISFIDRLKRSFLTHEE